MEIRRRWPEHLVWFTGGAGVDPWTQRPPPGLAHFLIQVPLWKRHTDNTSG